MLDKFKERKEYASLKTDLKAFVLKDQSQNIGYGIHRTDWQELMVRDSAYFKAVLYKKVVPKEFTEQLCKKEAKEAVKRKISFYKDFFSSDKSGNLAEQLGELYSTVICAHMKFYRERIISWYEANSLDVPETTIQLETFDDVFLDIPMRKDQEIEGNISPIIEEYVNRKILVNCNFVNEFNPNDLNVTYNKNALWSALELSPLGEKIKKLTNNYYVWNYNITFESIDKLYDKAYGKACLCAESFFETGYVQRLVNGLILDFISKLDDCVEN